MGKRLPANLVDATKPEHGLFKKKKKTQLLEKSSLISTTNIINMFNFNLVKDL